MNFCRAPVLHKTTYYWSNASDFQQHFWSIAFYISNISILYQSVTASFLETPDLVTCKWSTLLALKMFKENKKQQVESNILGLRSTQRTKVYVVELVDQGCSAKKVPWNIWQNSQENACTRDFFKINSQEVGLLCYLKRDSCICVFHMC